ncbi:MAG: nicotinamide-nucleotide amidohydrolase family protein [Anaerolineae bacterium]|nr:nicotinamide-nucleotide amidohydrolase family protein [Anaerolineae bacterium]
MKTSLEQRVGELLLKNGFKLAVAESCTGGLIGHRLTNIPGSSEYYLGSVTAYAYEAKERFLGVKRETLVEFGAVSRETVLEMAQGVRKALSGDFPMEKIIGLSVSGIAGPGGGMPGKPVGLVWIGLSTPEGDEAFEYRWHGDRIKNKEHSADAALQELLKYLRKRHGRITHTSSSEPRRILILTADAGFGHRSAANAITAALEEKFGSRCQVEIANPLDDRRTPFLLRESQADYDRLVREMPELYRFGYEASDAAVPSVIVESALTVLMFEALSSLVKKHRPEVILTTYPLYQAPLEAVYAINRYTIPTLTVITDLVDVHRLWFHTGVDALLVPTEEVRELAIKHGIAPSKIWITGIPVHPNMVRENRKKTEIRRELGWRTDLPTLLAVGSRRVERLFPILNVLNHSGSALQLAVVAGKDQALFEQLQSQEWHVPTHLYEFTDQMPAFMHASDALICKAGGLITTEALACGLPMMIIEAIPGQEIGNAEYIIKNEAGMMAEDPIQALEVVAHWMADNMRLLKAQAENARKLGKPLAAYDAAELVWEAAQSGPVDQAGKRIAGRRSLINLLKRNHVQWEENAIRSQR